MAKAELVADARAILGEGPWWDARAGILYWVDIGGRRLHAHDPSGEPDRSVDLGKKPGTVVGRAAASGKPSLLIALEDGFAFVDPDSGATEPLFDPEADRRGNRFNDGKCDSRGRFWVGSMDDSESGARTGALYRLGPDLGCERVLDGLGISNGLAWSPDDRTMYFIDTPTRRVDAFDFDREGGVISNRRTAFEIPQEMGFPDGMTIDEEGMLWVALWMGWGLGRWDPRGGRLLERLDLPAARVTSCAFGGPGMDRLYVTTAGAGPGEASQPHAGGLFACEPGLKGASSTPFAG